MHHYFHPVIPRWSGRCAFMMSRVNELMFAAQQCEVTDDISIMSLHHQQVTLPSHDHPDIAPLTS
jgi:hypothetical protein